MVRLMRLNGFEVLDGVLCGSVFSTLRYRGVYRCIYRPHALAAQSSADCALRAIRDLSFKCVCAAPCKPWIALLHGMFVHRVG